MNQIEHLQEQGEMEGSSVADNRQLFLKLHSEFRLLQLVWHRNKNQHRVALWWRRLGMLKSNCAQVLDILQKRVLKSKNNTVRLFKLVNGYISKQIARTYRDFNGVIALGQFVTLGVVLIGILSRIYNVYMDIMRCFEDNFKELGCLEKAKVHQGAKEQEPLLERGIQLGSTLEDYGEEIIIDNETVTNKNTVPTMVPSQSASGLKPKVQQSAKKKKKKKSKSAIDSIFG